MPIQKEPNSLIASEFIFSKVVPTQKLFCICQCAKCGLKVFSKNNSVRISVCACGTKVELQKFKISESDVVEVHK